MVETEAEELKKELQRLVMEVIGGNQEDNDGNKVDHRVGNIPVEFRCPISKEMMRDPVVLCTGQLYWRTGVGMIAVKTVGMFVSTCPIAKNKSISLKEIQNQNLETYDRPSINKWLKDVYQMCPQARGVISNTVLTPNHLVWERIQQWCKANNVQLLPPIKDLEGEVVVTNSDEDHLNGLLQRLSTLSDQKQAAKEIRIVSEHPLVIPLLIKSLTRGNIDTRANAAVALSALSSLDSNKKLIGEAGALKPLIDLLVEYHDHPTAMSDSALAIFQLCGLAENKRRLVSGGVVRLILQKMQNGAHIDRLLSVLAMLATHQDAIKELVELRAVKFLLQIIRESTCESTTENGIVIVFSMCEKNRAVLKEVGEEEKAHGTISKLAEQGSETTKRKANSVWEWLSDADRIRPSRFYKRLYMRLHH
ncbi:U-box domain-containing protein 9-like [Silene latifolia]|uniref:U-box domain-containing protein 9-like n=1 Tax=Silene latifolia TaxID=37657 RepID=UPI003D779DE6